MANAASTWLIYSVNGFLVILYFAIEHLPLVLSWIAGLGVLILLDTEVAEAPGHRPLRYGRGQIRRESITHYLYTPTLLVLWTLVALKAPSPIPWIGALMWLSLLLVPLCIPLERPHLVSRLKWLLATYTIMVGAFILLLSFQLSPEANAAWSKYLHQPGSGEIVYRAILSSVVPYALLMLWIIAPMMFFGYIIQRFAIQSKTIVAPWMTVEQRIRELRTRGEEEIW
jgi:hypothetical protein